MRRLLATIIGLTLAASGRLDAQRVRLDNLPAHVIVDSCSGCGGASGPIAIDQTTPGTTNGVSVTNVPHIVCDSGCGSPPATPDTDTFTAGVTSASITAGVYDDTLTALSAGVSAAYRMTTYRALHVNLRDSLGNEVSPLTAAQLAGMAVTVAGNVGVSNATIPGLSVVQDPTSSPWIVSGGVGTAYNSGDAAPTPTVGQVPLARVDFSAPTYSDGELRPLSLFLDGSLAVATTSVVSAADAADIGDFSAVHLGTTMGVGGFFDDVAVGTLAENTSGSVRLSTNRNLYTTLRDAAGNERGANVSAANALKVDGSAVTQPVSLATLPALVAGAAVIGHVIADTGSTTAVTGNVTAVQSAAANLHTMSAIDQTVPGTTNRVDIGIVTTKTALTASLPTSGSVGVASAALVAANASRKGLVLVNLSNATVCFGVGATAVLNSGVCLQAGAVWTMNEYTFATGVVNAIASAAASTVAVQEFQ